jgi:hypothetical protein
MQTPIMSEFMFRVSLEFKVTPIETPEITVTGYVPMSVYTHNYSPKLIAANFRVCWRSRRTGRL